MSEAGGAHEETGDALLEAYQKVTQNKGAQGVVDDLILSYAFAGADDATQDNEPTERRSSKISRFWSKSSAVVHPSHQDEDDNLINSAQVGSMLATRLRLARGHTIHVSPAATNSADSTA